MVTTGVDLKLVVLGLNQPPRVWDFLTTRLAIIKSYIISLCDWVTQHGTKQMMTSPRRNNGNYGRRQVILARRRLNGVNRRRNENKYAPYRYM